MRSHPRLNGLDLEACTGLRPSAWLVTEPGVSREDVKEFLLGSGRAFVADAVFDVPSLCLRILEGLATKERVLGATTRQEVLRNLLRETFRERTWTELRKLRHQRGFYKKLDSSLQALRLTYGTEEERRAQLERLGEYPSALRSEVNELVILYEEWLAREKWWDLPRLLLAAGAVCADPSISLRLPERIQLLAPKIAESRFEGFFDELGRRTAVERLFLVDPDEVETGEIPKAREIEDLSARCEWAEWHTLDDAAEHLAEAFRAAARAGTLGDHGVLIPDQPEVRRTLMRALRKSGIPLRDPRDPTQVRGEEEIKRALLPLRLVVGRSAQRLLVEWIRSETDPNGPEKVSEMLDQLFEDGRREGLTPAFRARFPVLSGRLDDLETHFQGKLSAVEWSELHLDFLGAKAEMNWIRPFFETVWRQYLFDLAVIGEREKKRGLKYFFERFENRVWEATPPIEKRQYPEGLELFRLGTTPVRLPRTLWAFGLPARWTSLEEIGDYALSARDREVLAGSFLIRSSLQEGRFRRSALRLWIREADHVHFVDAAYAFDGRERETIGPLLRELGLALEPKKAGASPRFLPSFLSRLDAPPRSIELAADSRKVIRASDLELYSKCGFQALVRGRWRLSELRESDLEVRPEAKGILLHEAAKWLLQSRDENGDFRLSADEALGKALERTSFRGLFRSPRLEKLTYRECLRALEDFREKERLWWETARTDLFSLEGPDLHWEKNGVVIRARPDRVDSHPDGLWLIDYKSGGQNPAGGETLERMYRLQLPIYALALRAHTGEEVLGYQYVPLKKKSSRTTGLTTPAYFGKEPGALLQSTRKSRSMVDEGTISEIWDRFEYQVEADLGDYMGGRFRVEPRKSTDCARCFARDACGQRRFPNTDDSEESENE